MIASLASPGLNAGEAAGHIYLSIQNLSVSNFNDILYGDEGSNSLQGFGGADLLDGGQGIDYGSSRSPGSGRHGLYDCGRYGIQCPYSSLMVAVPKRRELTGKGKGQIGTV